ncbi:hypothetical protein OG455_16765 [Kitasatospora sp. NBC_01287]|uniref:hypothetical protein n=1 Tax=Kitasatospora sp. NBC_01287 TaxID=2903573 RepID=UPI002259E386|nr:hypothetical protein [Kitasatospora sp. NBC_01287]MCX4747151.1 hypothetical protein [Kitasatospora sp. NBC_01287]
MPPRTGTVAAVTVTVLGLGVLGATFAPMAGDLLASQHIEESSYTSGAQAKTARASVPRWLPDNATAVRYKLSTKDGDRLLRAHLPGGTLPVGCTTGGGPQTGTVKLSATWFPAGRAAAVQPTASCGGYRVVLDGEQLYAWQDGADLIAAAR